MRHAKSLAMGFVFSVTAIVVGILTWDKGLHNSSDAAGVVCGPGGAPISMSAQTGVAQVAHTVAAEAGLLSFFTNNGAYMPRVHCMVNEAGTTDWPWVWALLALNLIVIAGYTRIFSFWWRSYRKEEPEDRNTKLMDLAWIFLWCAVCGYATSVLMFVWPAYRLLVFFLVPLAVFTWKFCANLHEMNVSLSAKRLERELEEALRARTVELEREVEIRTAELCEARDAERAANEAKSAFIATVSHEIRTPLNAIMGYSSLIAEGDLDAKDRSRYAGVIRRNGDHLATVINDVLDISKIESKNLSIERVQCSPGEILQDVVSLLTPKATNRGITIEGAVESEIPVSVVCDPTRMRQVLLNLGSNAVKFTPQGSVRIVASAESTEIPGYATLRFRVIDTGIGMTTEHLDHVFEPFRQAEPGTTRRFGGTGLGLAISRSLSELMGGSLTVQSTHGEGSIFTATMSVGVREGTEWVSKLGPPSDDHQATQEPTGQLGGRVLIVDDSIDNRRLFVLQLKRAGLRCTEARDGLEAVELFAAARVDETPFSLVLMDIEMPRCDGVEAMRRIRAVCPDTPIVVLTAQTMQGERERLLGLGFDDYAPKPIRRAALIKVCETWIRREEDRDAA